MSTRIPSWIEFTGAAKKKRKQFVAEEGAGELNISGKKGKLIRCYRVRTTFKEGNPSLVIEL